MNNLVIPPSPSWYISNIIACNNDGFVAYGARHEVVIIKTREDIEITPYTLDYNFIPLAHKDRITCLTFAPINASETFKNCLVTASDDGSVRLWDVVSLELKMINSGPKVIQKITAVDWSQSDPNIVISVSDQGIIHCWDLLSNKLRKINIGPKINPICLVVCPHDKQLVAVGAKSGIVLIVSLKGEGSIKFRMRTHDSDVVSLSWCPVKYNIFQENATLKSKHDSAPNGVNNGELESEATKLNSNDLPVEDKDSESLESLGTKQNSDDEKKFELLLASGGKDRSIYFWRAGTDGRYETFINLPQQPLASGYRSKMVGDKGGNSIWACLRWVNPYTLLSGSQFGELLSWDLSALKNNKNEKDKKNQVRKVKLLHSNHSKGLFSIACPTEPSKSGDDKRLIWTTALDRKLIACSLTSGKIVTELSTIGGVVYCMAVSPLDPNRIAIGVGDGKIIIWNMGSVNKLDVTVHWQKINSKVMALDWHPTEESWLAFGTGEGRVGLLDVNFNKPPVIFRQHYRRSVYRVMWASHIKEKDASHTGKYELALYSVGDGEILQHSVNTPEKEPVKLNDILKKADESSKFDKTPGRTEFVMNHDRSLISVGNENGIVYILDGKTLEKCLVLMAFKKIVQCLAWHPASVTSDPSGLSPYSNWLAAASDCVKVFSISADGKISETVAVLSLQTEKIVDISWSPHLNGHIVSVSYDYTAQVWDVVKQTPLVNYNKHHNAVLCAVWSPLNPEFIITGSSDNTLRVWKLSEQPDSRPSEKKKHRVSNLLKRITNAPEAVSAPELNQSNLRGDSGSSTISSSQSKNSTSAKSQINTEEINPVQEWESGQLKRVRGKSLFPVSASALNVSKHLDVYYQHWKANKTKKGDEINNSDSSVANGTPLLNTRTEKPAAPLEKELMYFDFFDDRKSMRRLMKVEEDQLRLENRLPLASYCSLWGGDITELIKDAMSRKCLDDYLMSLAPMSSYRVWQEACVVYSEQLTNQGDFLKAASYLLAVHKVEETIDLLCEHKFYREAVALAKCRLSNDDPIVHKVVRKYAEYAVSNGMLNLAAHCYLSLDDPLAASQIVARCKDLKSLKMAALLASEANAVEIADSLAKEAFCSSLMAGDFDTCSDIISDHPNLEFLKIWIKTNKMLSENKKLDLPTVISWLQGNAIDIEPILDRVKEDVKNFDSCYDKLKSNVNCFNALDTEKQLWLYISSHLSLAGASDSHAVALNHLVQSLAAGYRFQTLNNKNDVLLHICIVLAPKGAFSEKSLFKLQSGCSEEKNLISSMHGFLLAGIVCWLNEHLDEVKQCINDKKSLSEKDKISSIKDDKKSSLSEKDDKKSSPEKDAEKSSSEKDDKKSSSEKDAEKSSSVKDDKKLLLEKDDEVNNFKWLDSVINMCQEDLFDRRNIEYFKNETMIKNLELKIASSRCNPNDKQEQRVLLTAVRGKNRKTKKESNKKGSGDSASDDNKERDSVDKGTDQKVIENAVINVEDEAVSIVSDNNAVIDCKGGKDDEKTDESNVIENVDNSDLGSKLITANNSSIVKETGLSDGTDLGDKVKALPTSDFPKSQTADKLENKGDNCSSKSNLSVKVVNFIDKAKNVPSNPSLVIEFNNDDDSKALQKLNNIKTKFESEKVSIPNPFYVFCQLQNILTLLKDDDPQYFETINNKIQTTWKNANI